MSFLTLYGQRTKEWEDKSKALSQKVLGSQIKEMMHVELLATDPSCQGRGYGGQVLDYATGFVSEIHYLVFTSSTQATLFKADAQGRSMWLFSSNTNNTEFYNSHGFFTAGNVVLGEEDPAWDEPPVIVPIVCHDSHLNIWQYLIPRAIDG